MFYLFSKTVILSRVHCHRWRLSKLLCFLQWFVHAIFLVFMACFETSPRYFSNQQLQYGARIIKIILNYCQDKMFKLNSLLLFSRRIREVDKCDKYQIRKLTQAKRSSQHASNQLDFLAKRNLIQNIYPESEEYRDKLQNLLQRPCSVYAGFDATSDSLHVGNLVTIMNLLHLRSFGHRVICVIGDATTKIGDPSGHSKDRLKLEYDVIEKNSARFEQSIMRIFDNHEKYFITEQSNNVKLQKPLIIRNSDWYREKNVIEFIGEAFRHVRVGNLLHKKSISERLGSNEGMNMAEFSYQIFQAYDWLVLRERYDCRLQVGGSDQAGNIYSGHDFIKKRTGQTDSIGLLTPLITNSAGKKLGKTSLAGGPISNIWLDPSRTSPYQLYQFFHQTPDSEVEKLLKIYSFHDLRTIEDLIYTNLTKSINAWHCQKKLAHDVCKLIHGDNGLQSAKRITQAFFQRDPLDIAQLTDNELDELFDNESLIRLVHQDGLRVLDLVKRADCFKSDMEAERVINAGALRINGTVITSFNKLVTRDMIIGNDVTVMRLGKKNYFLFKWIK